MSTSQFEDLTREQLVAKLIELDETNRRLCRIHHNNIAFKVGPKGGLSMYGLARFPLTLYAAQWERLLDNVPAIRAALDQNRDSLVTKKDGPNQTPEPRHGSASRPHSTSGIEPSTRQLTHEPHETRR